MSVEASIPAAAAVAVSLVGYFYARLMTSRYDKNKEEELDNLEPNETRVNVDVDRLAEALEKKGVNKGRLSEALSEVKGQQIVVQAQEVAR